MSRSIVISGENGELYHITEDELRSSFKMPDKTRRSDRIRHLVGTGKMSHYVNQKTGHGVSADWDGGPVQTVTGDHIHFLNLGVTQNSEE